MLEHDPEKPALGLRPDGWVPVFLATNAERAEIMLDNQEVRQFIPKSSRPMRSASRKIAG